MCNVCKWRDTRLDHIIEGHGYGTEVEPGVDVEYLPIDNPQGAKARRKTRRKNRKMVAEA